MGLAWQYDMDLDEMAERRICGELLEPKPWMRTASHCGRPKGHPGRHEVSTRRRSTTGTVHEMADLGVKTLCGRDLAEPWNWVDDAVDCAHCLRVSDGGEDRP